MTTPRIEEMLESWNKLFQYVVDIKKDDVLGDIITTTGGLNDEQKDWFIKHVEEAHQAGLKESEEDIMLLTEEIERLREDVERARQAGIDEAVEVLENAIMLDPHEDKHKWYNAGVRQGIKDLKALQDNK